MMTTFENDFSTSTNEPASLPRSESAWRLITVAVGWILLAMLSPVTIGFGKGVAKGFVRGLTNGASVLQIPLTLDYILTILGAAGIGVVLVYGAFIRGRIVGDGDPRLGLGVAPIARRPIVIGLAIIAVTYAALLDYTIYHYRPDIFFRSSSFSGWLTLFSSLVVVLLAPLAEELFFRGWLWTGLRKRWGALPTALLTAALWLLTHIGQGYVVLLIPLALILTVARQFGKSVKATIPIHAIYNLASHFPLIVLILSLSEQGG